MQSYKIVQVQSPSGAWRAAKVCDINDATETVLIHYEFFDSKHDEWILMSSSRIRTQ